MEDVEELKRQIEELKRQGEELKNTVENLKNSTIKVETNTAKLARMKNEVIKEVFPEDMIRNMNPAQISYLKRDITIRTNEMFFIKTGYKDEAYKKMAKIIFERPDPEKRLEAYLGIYRRVCGFMAEMYRT